MKSKNKTEDIPRDKGQPTFKEALKKVLEVKPKDKKKKGNK